MRNKDLKLTSVKIHEDLADNFKIETVRTGMTLQKLINRSIHLFLTDADYKYKLLAYNQLATSGSI